MKEKIDTPATLSTALPTNCAFTVNNVLIRELLAFYILLPLTYN